MNEKKFFWIITMLVAIVLMVTLAGRKKEPEIIYCKISNCDRRVRPGSNYCPTHCCDEPGCGNIKASGTRYCTIHYQQYNKSDYSSSYTPSTKSSTKTYNKSSSSSRSYSSTTKKSYNNSGSYKSNKSRRADYYDVNDYDDPDSFADDKYEEFYDYEDDYDDEDEAYDAAVDYWYDNYDDEEDDE